MRTGEPRALAESQKFPWSPELYPSVCLTSGGLLAAARRALEDGVAAALVSGFHHAHADHGEGFCTFNGLVVAAEAMRAAGEIRTVAVLDMDLHYGNGTASLAESRPWLLQHFAVRQRLPGQQAVSRRVRAAPRRRRQPPLDRAAERCGAQGDAGRDGAGATAARGARPSRPLLYQAGADPYREDPYSPLDLDHDDLQERDRLVFAFAKAEGLPIAWVLAGGYTEDTSKVVQVHLNTFTAALEVYGTA